MGGSGKGGTPTNATAENAQAGLATQLTSLLGVEQNQSSQLFNLAFPGMQQSTDFYQALASGNPDLISKVIAPATQQVQQASAGAKQNILSTSPAGGERNLALEQVDVNQGAQVGSLASQGYTGAFNALAQLSGQGVGQSQGAANTAIGAGQAAGSQWSNIVNENVQQKGATLGAIGSGVSSAATLGAAFA
jgi:hypothetical protein